MGGDGIEGPLLVEWGVAARTMQGQDRSGDRYLVQLFPRGVLIAVVDGLGHGSEAAAVSEIAISTLQGRSGEPVLELLKYCHEALRGTRGVVMNLASFSALDHTLSWAGVGNVEGVLLGADTARSREFVLQRGGVIGYRLPSLRMAVLTLKRGDTLIFASDGIRHGFVDTVALNDSPQQIADHILAEYGKETDDALALVARYLGGEP